LKKKLNIGNRISWGRFELTKEQIESEKDYICDSILLDDGYPNIMEIKENYTNRIENCEWYLDTLNMVKEKYFKVINMDEKITNECYGDKELWKLDDDWLEKTGKPKG
jgi:hypothetical protein